MSDAHTLPNISSLAVQVCKRQANAGCRQHKNFAQRPNPSVGRRAALCADGFLRETAWHLRGHRPDTICGVQLRPQEGAPELNENIPSRVGHGGDPRVTKSIVRLEHDIVEKVSERKRDDKLAVACEGKRFSSQTVTRRNCSSPCAIDSSNVFIPSSFKEVSETASCGRRRGVGHQSDFPRRAIFKSGQMVFESNLTWNGPRRADDKRVDSGLPCIVTDDPNLDIPQ